MPHLPVLKVLSDAEDEQLNLSVSGLNRLRPSSNRDDHRFAQVLTAQQAISVFRQAKTGGQFGHVTRELSDLDFTL
jgi:hypothetical protein